MRTAVVTITSGRDAHLHRQREGLAAGPPDLHVVVGMGEEPQIDEIRGAPPVVRVGVPVPGSGLPLAAARNTGVAAALAAGAELLVLLDVDCIPAPRMVLRYAEAATRTPDPALLCGPVHYLPPPPLQGYPSTGLAALAPPHPARPAPPNGTVVADDRFELFWSLSFAVTAATWAVSGGFCEDYTGYGGEDTDFAHVARARGATLHWVGGAVAFHQHHPPARHSPARVAEIVDNARLFHRRHGWWPMAGWLRELAANGEVEFDPDRRVLRALSGESTAVRLGTAIIDAAGERAVTAPTCVGPPPPGNPFRMTDSRMTTLITQLKAMERLTRTEVQIARTRVAQARTDAVRRELTENADNGVRRADRIAAQLRNLDAVPDVVAPAAARVLAMLTSTLEQARPVDEALLDDLALEHQLLDRARYVRTLADQAGRRDVQRLADDLVTAHTATVEWITTVLAEEALGGPTALRPTPLQRVASGVNRAATLPTRTAVAWFDTAINAVRRTGEATRDTAGNVAGTVAQIGEATREVATAGRDAALNRAEQVASRDGAVEVAGAVHRTRRDLGALDATELPVTDYDELTAQSAIAAVRALSAPEDISAVVAYEEQHKNRSGVVSAAQARFATVAKVAAGVDA